MEKTYSIRKIDNLGRIVIPMDMRKALELHDWDEISIRLEGDRVILSKAHDACTFCGSETALSSFGGKFVCASCLAALRQSEDPLP